jgi:hypothetical protein
VIGVGGERKSGDRWCVFGVGGKRAVYKRQTAGSRSRLQVIENEGAEFADALEDGVVGEDRGHALQRLLDPHGTLLRSSDS